MAAVVIGVDPHKASRTAVAISAAEEPRLWLNAPGVSPPSLGCRQRGRR